MQELNENFKKPKKTAHELSEVMQELLLNENLAICAAVLEYLLTSVIHNVTVNISEEDLIQITEDLKDRMIKLIIEYRKKKPTVN